MGAESIKFAFRPQAIASAALVIASPVMSDAPAVLADGVVSHAGPLALERNRATVSAERKITIVEEPSEWTKAMNRRFNELARSVALGKADGEDQKELENLVRLRRKLHHPRTSEEILWEYQQRKVTDKLMRALEEYVEFHGQGEKEPA